MKVILTAGTWVCAIAILSGGAYALYRTAAPYFEPPCAPILYTGVYDTRFGISEAEYTDALADAARLWNDAAGKPLITVGEGIPVSLVYGEIQQVAELGDTIDSEQFAYDRKRDQVDTLKQEFQAAKRTYERMRTAFEQKNAIYHDQVAYWNAEGGAPEAEYAALQREQAELVDAQKELNAQADLVNAFADQINERVAELNALARDLNAEVDRFNEHAGEDFDQGVYTKDAEGERISIYGFNDGTELRRVLAHEFGHALGFEHTENPDSIMYSYNIGETFALSDEDRAELQRVCKLN